jgi:hypothetical protein
MRSKFDDKKNDDRSNNKNINSQKLTLQYHPVMYQDLIALIFILDSTLYLIYSTQEVYHYH